MAGAGLADRAEKHVIAALQNDLDFAARFLARITVAVNDRVVLAVVKLPCVEHPAWKCDYW